MEMSKNQNTPTTHTRTSAFVLYERRLLNCPCREILPNKWIKSNSWIFTNQISTIGKYTFLNPFSYYTTNTFSKRRQAMTWTKSAVNGVMAGVVVISVIVNDKPKNMMTSLSGQVFWLIFRFLMKICTISKFKIINDNNNNNNNWSSHRHIILLILEMTHNRSKTI